MADSTPGPSPYRHRKVGEFLHGKIPLPAEIADAIDRDFNALVEQMEYEAQMPDRLKAAGWISPTSHHLRQGEEHV